MSNLSQFKGPSVVPVTVPLGGTGVITITGLVKGNGAAAMSSASAGTDFVVPGGALGTPSSGTLTNCTFPTLNQSTSGTAGGLTGTPNISVGTIGASGLVTLAQAGNGTGNGLALTRSGATDVGFSLDATDDSFGITRTNGDRVFKLSPIGSIIIGLSNSARIQGDFMNATVSLRTMFQSSITNGTTEVAALPNGTGTSAVYTVYGGSDPDNAQRGAITITGGTSVTILSSYAGTPASGTYLPLLFSIGGAERARFDTVGTLTLSNALREIKSALGNITGASVALNLANGNYFTATVTGAVTSWSLSNIAASGNSSSFILDLTNGAAYTVTWWSGMKWAGGTAPILTTSGRDVLGFFTHDGGTTWSGLLLAKDIK